MAHTHGGFKGWAVDAQGGRDARAPRGIVRRVRGGKVLAHVSTYHYDVVHTEDQFMRFEWDIAKSNANATKHGVTFEDAKTVFFDDNALMFNDPDHSADEARFILLDRSAKVAHERRIRL